MAIPELTAAGHLPEGRHVCSLDAFEDYFVNDPRFSRSTKRAALFADFLAARDLLLGFDPDLIERAWFGGGFTTDKLDPEDIDVTFVLKAATYHALSKNKRDQIGKLARKGGFGNLDLDVDGFFFVRERIANPWKGSGITDESVEYMGARGAWDDWWSRVRTHGGKSDPPVVEDSDPVRGYVEVIFDGTDSSIPDA